MKTFKALDRNEMKQVKGGGTEICAFKVNGVWQDSQAVIGGGDGANAACVAYVQSNPGSRCGYDCDGDGWQH